MLDIKSLKSKIKKSVNEKLSEIDGVVSVTFVGSFESSLSIDLISDIDIIVIVKKLNKNIFDKIKKNISEIEAKNIGLAGYNIKLNMSFGPLKFNNDKTAIFHLMVYDIEGHRNHVLESPFTCLDWEANDASFGTNLRDIYTAHGVQIDDLLSSRRSLSGYINDLKSSSITYRAYNFSEKNVTEDRLVFDMDERHRKEYAYHVIKFLQKNLLKILSQENLQIDIHEQAISFNKLDKKFEIHTKFLIELHKWKYENGNEPQSIIKRLTLFIDDLTNWINNLKLSELTFYRHEETELNDGSFLGQRRNPDIIKKKFSLEKNEYSLVVTSSLQRSISTGLLLNSKKYIESTLLDEIDYGLAEGMQADEFKKEFPLISNQWNLKKDPKFPEGENQSDVLTRLNSFLKNSFLKNNTAIVTHNVVLRALIGQMYNIDLYKWFKLSPKHLEKNKFFKYHDILIPNFSKKQQAYYKDSVSEFSFDIVKYAIFLIPPIEIGKYIQKCKKLSHQIEPDANYVNHPPHSTLFLFNSNRLYESDIISALDIEKVSFEIKDWIVFKNDVLTDKNTLALSVKKTKEILKIQKEIANSLLEFINKPMSYTSDWAGIGANTVDKMITSNMDKEYRDSYDKYGFPFVGDHWIPHLTIASIINKELISKLQSIDFDFSKLSTGDICLYRIDGEDHTLIHKWT